VRHWLVLVLFLLGLGTLRLVACGAESCVESEDCDDGNPCTRDWCPEPISDWDFSICGADDEQTCQHSWSADGTPCGSDKVCVDRVCGENLCEGVLCEGDGNDCTEDVCNFVTGTCDFPPVVCDDDNPCTKDACNPAAGCTFTPVDDGTWCIARGGELWLMGVCEARACVGPCEPWVSGKTYPYPCPIEDYEDLVCCSGREYCQPFCGW